MVPVFEAYEVAKTINQDDRMNEDLPFGSRGGIAVRHRFPLDAEYVVKVRLRRQLYDYIVGLGHPQKIEIRLDGERIKVFTVGGEDHGLPRRQPLRESCREVLGGRSTLIAPMPTLRFASLLRLERGY